MTEKDIAIISINCKCIGPRENYSKLYDIIENIEKLLIKRNDRGITLPKNENDPLLILFTKKIQNGLIWNSLKSESKINIKDINKCFQLLHSIRDIGFTSRGPMPIRIYNNELVDGIYHIDLNKDELPNLTKQAWDLIEKSLIKITELNCDEQVLERLKVMLIKTNT